MGICNIDHSVEDVLIKLESQEAFLPSALYARVKERLELEIEQDVLNRIFHSLKKYDLATIEEQQVRNKQLEEVLTKS